MLAYNCDLTIENITFTGRKDPGDKSMPGGGIAFYLDNNNLLLNFCKVRYNLSDNSTGGLQFNGKKSSIVMNNCVITHNVTSHIGGGVSIYGAYGTYIINNCAIVNNYAREDGGLTISGNRSSAVINDSIISENEASY